MIYLFHMPLFVFVSGLFSKNVVKRRDRAFDDLMVPFFAAQFIWLLVLAVTNGPGWALDHILDPQFQLWYLVALFMWRLLLPDLLRVRFILPIAAALFFVGQMVSGIGNALAVTKTIGFLLFFLLGYRTDFKKVVRVAGRVPLALAVVAFVAVFAGLFAAFSCTGVSYEAVFNFLRHINPIGGLGSLSAYAAAFIGAVVLSLCFLRLAVAFKAWKPIVNVGKDTMPLYILHGWVVYAICGMLALLPSFYDLIALLVLLLLTAGVTFVLSIDACRNGYDRVMASIARVVTIARHV